MQDFVGELGYLSRIALVTLDNTLCEGNLHCEFIQSVLVSRVVDNIDILLDIKAIKRSNFANKCFNRHPLARERVSRHENQSHFEAVANRSFHNQRDSVRRI